MRQVVAMLLGAVAGGCPGPGTSARVPPPSPAGPTAQPPPVPSASSAPALPPKRAAGAIGTTDPLVFEAASRVGSWVAFCQARSDSDGDGRVAVVVGPRGELAGDRMQRFLTLGNGVERAVTELSATDPSGRYVVVDTVDGFRLIDSFTAGVQSLDSATVDARRDELDSLGHRAFAFDAAGSRLARLVSSDVVIRELQTGTERRVPLGPGTPWRIEFDVTGRRLLVQVVATDTNGDGALTWPVPARLAPTPCPGALPTLRGGATAGDTVITRVLHLDTGRVEDAPGLAALLPQARLLRDESGRLSFERRSGARPRVLTEDSCQGRLVAVDADHSRFLVACQTPSGRSALNFVTPSTSRNLDVTLGPVVVDARPALGARLVALHPGSAAALFDFRNETLHPLGPGRLVLATGGDAALVRDASRLLHVQVVGKTVKETVVAEDLQPVADLLVGVRHTLVSPWVVETATGKRIGRAPEAPLALDDLGRVLSAAQVLEGSLRLGPLVYRAPLSE